jgi:hypothetical protein
MKAASILLALVFVLGFSSKAGASGIVAYSEHNYTFKVGEQTLGFADYYSDMAQRQVSNVYLGTFGTHEVLFTATQGLIGFCCILATLIILPALLTVRWKKKRANS